MVGIPISKQKPAGPLTGHELLAGVREGSGVAVAVSEIAELAASRPQSVQALQPSAQIRWSRDTGSIVKLATVKPGNKIVAPTGTWAAGQVVSLFIQGGPASPDWDTGVFDLGEFSPVIVPRRADQCLWLTVMCVSPVAFLVKLEGSGYRWTPS
jgi:hypothetical protein